MLTVRTNQVVRRTDKFPIRSHVVVPVQHYSTLGTLEAVKVILFLLHQEATLRDTVMALAAFIEGGLQTLVMIL